MQEHSYRVIERELTKLVAESKIMKERFLAFAFIEGL